MNERVILGLDTCPACGAVVELRLTKTSKAYYICDGTLDEKACSFRGTYGERHSRKLRARGDGEPESEKPSGESESEEANDAGAEGSDDDKRDAGDRKSVV